MHLNQLILALVAIGSSLALKSNGEQETEALESEANDWLDALDQNVCGKRIIKQGSGLGLRQQYNQTRLHSGTRYLASKMPDILVNYMSTGYEAYTGQYPWFVALRTRFGWRGYAGCGGVIIHKNLVLTAAHCVTSNWNQAPDELQVYAGVTNLDDTSHRQVRAGRSVSRPREFNPHSVENPRARRSHDIAVIRVDRPFEYNEYVQPICLPEAGSNLYSQENCMAAGLGMMDSRTRRVPRNIMTMPMRVCRRTRTLRIDEICYESADPYRYPGRPCVGDSGSAMICPNEPERGHEAQFYAVGVVSNGPSSDCIRGLVEHVNYADVIMQREELLNMARSVLS